MDTRNIFFTLNTIDLSVILVGLTALVHYLMFIYKNFSKKLYGGIVEHMDGRKGKIMYRKGKYTTSAINTKCVNRLQHHRKKSNRKIKCRNSNDSTKDVYFLLAERDFVNKLQKTSQRKKKVAILKM